MASEEWIGIRGVSFVVIARNEEYAISKCLSAIAKMNLADCEVLCVDSGSDDDTASVMLTFAEHVENMKIFSIEGSASAAIARNVGIKNARKEFIFFVDGDTELHDGFVAAAIRKMEEQGYGAVTGKLKEYQYSRRYQEIRRKVKDRFSILEEKELSHCGGNFIASRAAVLGTGLFNEEFKTLEEIDFTMRLSAVYRLSGIPVEMGIHHTIPYDDKGRVREVLFKKSGVYVGRIVRKHVAHNSNAVFSLANERSGPFWGLFWYFAAVVIAVAGTGEVLLVIPGSFLADMLYGKLKRKGLLRRLVSHYVEPLFIVWGFLFFWGDTATYRVVRIYG